MDTLRVLAVAVVCFEFIGLVKAQQTEVKKSLCDPWKFQAPAGAMTFRDRTCWYEARLAKPSLALRGAMVAGFGQWRNNPRVFHESAGEFGYRFAVFYARRSAQSGGELIAGYLHHEDPRPRVSQEHGVWNRARSAVLSVLATSDADGGARIALAPIAGAFSSGMMSVPCYRMNNSAADGLRRSGFVYGMYFGTALLREFKPDLTVMAFRLLRQKRPD